MRVLRLIGGLDPVHGGPPVSAVNSMIAAHRAGAETTVAFPIEPPKAEAVDAAITRLTSAGVDVLPFDPSSPPSARALSWGVNRPLADWIRREAKGYDLVHCHGAWQMATLLATVVARRHQVLALTPHESLTRFDVEQTSALWLRVAKTGLRRRYLNRFHLIAMASGLEAADSVPPDMDRPGSIKIIPHPVYDETAHRARARIQTIGPLGVRLGFIGRLQAKKNVDAILRTLPRLSARLTLTVAGAGPDEETLKRLAHEFGLDDRVRWLGFVSGQEKAAFFRDVDLLVMPSDYECFGMAAAEAMVEGIPVVVSPRTGIAETILAHGGGEIAEPTPNDLGRVIDRLAHRHDRMAELSREASAAAEAEFSFAAHGKALVAAYESALASRRR